MYLHEPTYNIDELFSANYHIHTVFSRCAKPEMLLKDIIAEAQRAGLKEIALTDHIQPGEAPVILRNVSFLRQELNSIPHGIKVLMGSELSAYGINKYSLKYSKDLQKYSLDYRLYSHNHYHVPFWEQPEDRTAQGYKNHCKAVLTSVIKSNLADCLAHPFIDGYMVSGKYNINKLTAGEITNSWTDNELGDILLLGKQHKVAWELNTGALLGNPAFSRRYFNIGKEAGVCFNVGTDAHRICQIDTSVYKDDIKKILLG